MNTFLKVLPRQAHYYMLSDGSRYARHGTTAENNGVVVFANLERAEQFMMTVGAGLPEYQVVKRTDEQVLSIIAANGGKVCLTPHPLLVTVLTIEDTPRAVFGKEGANRTNTNWSSPPKCEG